MINTLEEESANYALEKRNGRSRPGDGPSYAMRSSLTDYESVTTQTRADSERRNRDPRGIYR